MSLGMRAPLTGLEIPRRYRLRGLLVFFLLHDRGSGGEEAIYRIPWDEVTSSIGFGVRVVKAWGQARQCLTHREEPVGRRMR